MEQMLNTVTKTIVIAILALGVQSLHQELHAQVKHVNVGIIQEQLEQCFTSIDEVCQNQEAVRVYPNPGPGIFTIEISRSHVDQEHMILIYNTMGKLIHKSGLEDTGEVFSGTIDLRKEAKGVYFLFLSNTQGQITKKLIIN